MLRLAVDRARDLCLTSLTMVGLSADEAATCADAVMFASLRGLDSHGMISIMPAIARNVARGTIVPGARIGVIGETATTAVLKGNGAAGPLVAAKAMDLAIAKAREYGLGAVTAFNCHHFGAASAYCARALPEKMIAISMCNAGPNVAPYGGAKGVHGTNPLAYALPAGDEVDIVLDIATSVTAYHQISKAARRGQTIPAGWALDATGRGTTDPAAALKGGVLLPFGGHKGYGLGLLVDVMTAALTGAPIGRSMNQRDTNPVEHGQSLLMLAMDPRKFAGVEAFTTRVDELVRDVHATPPAEGFREVVVPGELEKRQEAERTAKGIPFYAEDWETMLQTLEQAGLPARELAARFAPVEEQS